MSPTIYETYYTKENRNILSLTTFINTNQPRRNKLLNNLNHHHLNHVNINNCFNKNKLQHIYKNTKILINIHQTDDHHTFEELRALPALECGVIVISEFSPLNELIPYNNLIIWTSYDNIIDKVKEVMNNYDYYYDKIFSTENINILNNLSNKNYDVLQNSIQKLI